MNAAEAFRRRWDHPSLGVHIVKTAGVDVTRSLFLKVQEGVSKERKLHEATRQNDIAGVRQQLEAGAPIQQYTFALSCINECEPIVSIFLNELLVKYGESRLKEYLGFLASLRARSWRKMFFRDYVSIYMKRDDMKNLSSICCQWGKMLQVKYQLLVDSDEGDDAAFFEHANSIMYSWTFEEEDQLALAVQSPNGEDIALRLLDLLEEKESQLRFRKTCVYDAVRSGTSIGLIERMLQLMRKRNIKINFLSAFGYAVSENEEIARKLLEYMPHQISLASPQSQRILQGMVDRNTSADILAQFVHQSDIHRLNQRLKIGVLRMVSAEHEPFELLLKQSWVNLSLVEAIIMGQHWILSWPTLYSYPGVDVNTIRPDFSGELHSPISFQLNRKCTEAVYALLDHPDIDLSQDDKALHSAAFQYPDNEEIFNLLLDRGAVVSEELADWENKLLNTLIVQRRKKSARSY